MIELNLTAETDEEQLVKKHLQEMVSEPLAEKINNGVYIEKDGKRLLNKKTLAGFIEYAFNEAKKQAEKGQRVAAVEGKTIMGWCMHYFEEDDIIGTLYREDGTEYKPAIKTTVKPTVPVAPSRPTSKQASLFDMLEPKPEVTKEPDDETKTEPVKSYKASPMYQKYLDIRAQYKDCLLFLRLGDFYEAFSDSAEVAAKELNLTLTGRDCGLESRVPMCGIPFHAMDPYVNKLVEKGYKVAIAEDLKEPKKVEIKKPMSVDASTGELIDEDLTEEEMRCFDGHIAEPQELISEPDDEDDFDLTAERERTKYFDTEALVILSELFDNKITVL